jgi:sigma-B regulation protein RsbU (phosphoserine phosphatase)
VKNLADSVNTMANKLQNLVDQEKDLVRLEHELNVANEVQSSFIPHDYQKEGALVLASSYRSASECGGDFWGHYVLAPNIHLVLVGDATGHGIPAALVTAIAYATSHLCSHLPGAAESGKMTPALVLSLLNKALYDSLKGKLCMTFFAALIDTRNGKMIYSNGGHPFPIIVPKAADDDRLKSDKRKKRPYIFLSDIKKNGQPLGFDPESVYYNVPVEFRAGDRLVMYTDGIIECYNSEQKQWGTRNFEKSIQRNMTLDPTAFRDTIMGDLESYRRETPLADDATLVVISSDFKEAA